MTNWLIARYRPPANSLRDFLRLAREPERAVPVAGLPGGRAEAGQGTRFQALGAGLAGHGQRPAGVVERLGHPAHLHQGHRPAAQAERQQHGPLPRRGPGRVLEDACDRVVVLHGRDRIGGIAGGLGEHHARAAPLAAAGLGVLGGRGQHRRLADQAAPDAPQRRLAQREPQRRAGVVLHRPVQRVAQGDILGVQPPQAGRLPGAGVQADGSLFGHLGRVSGQRGGDLAVLADLGQQAGPVGAQRLQHDVPGPAVLTGLWRDQQRAVHQPRHGRPGPGSGHRLGPVQGEGAGERREGAERPLLVFV